MRIYLVVNVSWIVQYREQVGGQEVKPVEVKGMGGRKNSK